MVTQIDNRRPICPLLLFKNGDGIEPALCDYEPETRACSMGCKKRQVSHWDELELLRREGN